MGWSRYSRGKVRGSRDHRPRMAVTGASMVWRTLPAPDALQPRLGSGETTKTMRAGVILLVVGPQRIRS